MKLWIDDVRPAPEGYVWCKSVNIAKNMISTLADTYVVEFNPGHFTLAYGDTELKELESRVGHKVKIVSHDYPLELIDIDHDAGDYASDGGDYIRLLDWLEETGRNYPIRIHSMNPVGVQNMRAIIEKNGWKEVF